MLKQLYLLSESALADYIKASKDLKDMAVGMSAEDLKKNTEYVIEKAQINEIIEDESLKLSIDENGIAHIPITGMLTNNVTPSAAFFGESITTYNFISESIRIAEENPQVKEIFLEVNSGGGHVEGVEPAANAIFNTKKQTTARVHFMAASAAYWLASQADKIIAVGETSSFGSIGVATEFIDRSKRDKESGIKRIVLTSTDAPQKRIDITTDEGQAVVIERMDEIHSVFISQISRGRNLTTDFINKNFGSGKVMTSEKAIKNKMIDGIEGSLISDKQGNSTFLADAQTPGKPETTNPVKQDKTMDEKELLALLAKTEGALAAHEKIVAESKTDFAKASLEYVLALSESAKKEYDVAIETTKTEASTEIEAGKLSKADAKYIATVIASGSYGDSVKNVGVDALTGESDTKTFKMVVAIADEQAEKLKSLQVQSGQPDATPSAGIPNQKQEDDGKTKANAQALSDRINQQGKVL